MESQNIDLLEHAKSVLEANDHGTHTVPASNGLYPHQWLWDSCFTAIGTRHYDLKRAKMEILNLFTGQWHNGMMPNMILTQKGFARDSNIWRSWLNPNAPDDIHTSGITQPPMIAESVVQIGRKMKPAERRSWYKQVYPGLLAYHQWLYSDRDPHDSGLVLQIHPWETGLDNTPPWMNVLKEHQLPFWIQTIEKLKLGGVLNLFRRDTKYIPAEQRLNIIDALVLFSTQRRLRRKNYDTQRILAHSLFTIEDANFNAIFIRANQHLAEISKDINEKLPVQFIEQAKKSEIAFEELWDPYSSQYFSREFVSRKLIKIPSIATLIALYSGAITKERAEVLVGLLEDADMFGTPYPVPSTPINSEWFKPSGYWQGPSWVNTNWLIIDGLKRYGYDDHAQALTETTLDMISQNGCREYFSPLDGSGAGATDFSWTAALAIDLIQTNK